MKNKTGLLNITFRKVIAYRPKYFVIFNFYH